MKMYWLLMCLPIVCGYVNVVLIGSTKDTQSYARHYARFFNIPFYKKTSEIYPMRFIITSEEKMNVERAVTVDFKDYPHKDDTNLNYFISWVMQSI